jgi:hypothetical protein
MIIEKLILNAPHYLYSSKLTNALGFVCGGCGNRGGDTDMEPIMLRIYNIISKTEHSINILLTSHQYL